MPKAILSHQSHGRESVGGSALRLESPVEGLAVVPAFRYAAFISYSHARDQLIARNLQLTLEKFGMVLPLRRRVRIFRDESNLAANPDLWGAIESALDESDSFLLLASPPSAQSSWVQRELTRFLERHEPARLCVVLTEGWTPWTENASSF